MKLLTVLFLVLAFGTVALAAMTEDEVFRQLDLSSSYCHMDDSESSLKWLIANSGYNTREMTKLVMRYAKNSEACRDLEEETRHVNALCALSLLKDDLGTAYMKERMVNGTRSVRFNAGVNYISNNDLAAVLDFMEKKEAEGVSFESSCIYSLYCKCKEELKHGRMSVDMMERAYQYLEPKLMSRKSKDYFTKFFSELAAAIQQAKEDSNKTEGSVL